MSELTYEQETLIIERDKEKCGECERTSESIETCDSCGMVLCRECQNIADEDIVLCSSCKEDCLE